MPNVSPWGPETPELRAGWRRHGGPESPGTYDGVIRGRGRGVVWYCGHGHYLTRVFAGERVPRDGRPSEGSAEACARRYLAARKAAADA